MEHTDEWFDTLYTRYALSMVRTASAILNDHAVAEELVHDVFIILLLKRSEVESYKSPGVWLFRTLKNRIANEIQLARHTREVPLEDIHERYISSEEELNRLEDVLPSGLSREERQFLIWYYEEDLTHEEIAKRLGISEHASHGRLYRIKRKCFMLMSKEKNLLKREIDQSTAN